MEAERAGHPTHAAKEGGLELSSRSCRKSLREEQS